MAQPPGGLRRQLSRTDGMGGSRIETKKEYDKTVDGRINTLSRVLKSLIPQFIKRPKNQNDRSPRLLTNNNNPADGI